VQDKRFFQLVDKFLADIFFLRRSAELLVNGCVVVSRKCNGARILPENSIRGNMKCSGCVWRGLCRNPFLKWSFGEFPVSRVDCDIPAIYGYLQLRRSTGRR
jgi:hypothetical protein